MSSAPAPLHPAPIRSLASDDAVAVVLASAQNAGADAADVLITQGAATDISFRLGHLEDVERQDSRDLGLRVFVGRRSALVSTRDLSKTVLHELACRAVAMARLAPEDRFAGLAPADRLAREFPELDLEDPHDPDIDTLIAQASAVEEAARSVKGVTNSDGASAHFGRYRVTLGTSEGFRGSYGSTLHGVSVGAIAGSGTGMQRIGESTNAHHLHDLETPQAIGLRAGERAVARLRPRKVKTQTVPVIFDPDIGSGLLGHFVRAISGASVARGISFLKDSLGKPVFGEAIEIIDDPLRPRGLRSRPFDGEGVATAPRMIVHNGILQSWLLDCASAHQLGLATTGHAARNVGAPPSPTASNLYLKPGTLSPADLMADIPRGFYVTSLMDTGTNIVTGDYSNGAEGFWIENGAIAFPVSEVTIAGNLSAMFRDMTAANDLVFRYGLNTPTLRIEQMTVAGS